MASGGMMSSVGAQREAHAEPSHEHGGALELARAIAAQPRELLLGALHAARHEILAVGEDEVVVAAARERHEGAPGRARLTE